MSDSNGFKSLSVAGRVVNPAIVDLYLDRHKITECEVPFDIRFVRGFFESRFPEEIEALHFCGLYPDREGEVLDPYTGTFVVEDFRNIYEHDLSVAFASWVIAELLFDAKAINRIDVDRIVSDALYHDATKPYEILRRRCGRIVAQAQKHFLGIRKEGAPKGEALVEALLLVLRETKNPHALDAYARYLGWSLLQIKGIGQDDHELLNTALKRALVSLESEGLVWTQSRPAKNLYGNMSGLIKPNELSLVLSSDVIQNLLHSIRDPAGNIAQFSLVDVLRWYFPEEQATALARMGYSTGGPSYPDLLDVDRTGVKGIKGSWIELVVHLADDMTATRPTDRAEVTQTYFLTANERMIVSGLHERYRNLFLERGLGLNTDGQIVEVDLNVAVPESVRVIGRGAEVMTFISNSIAAKIKLAISPQSELAPEFFVKEKVKAAWHKLLSKHRRALGKPISNETVQLLAKELV